MLHAKGKLLQPAALCCKYDAPMMHHAAICCAKESRWASREI
jgi:hypothetical protein